MASIGADVTKMNRVINQFKNKKISEPKDDQAYHLKLPYFLKFVCEFEFLFNNGNLIGTSTKYTDVKIPKPRNAVTRYPP